MGVTNLNALTLDTGPVLPGSVSPIYTGNWYFVNETTGSDGNDGSAAAPYKTLAYAQSKTKANQNDVVAFQGSMHLTATLTWDKAQVHLIGMCAPIQRGKRARISVSGSTAFSPMVNVTASGCNFRNFGTFYGFNSASNNALPWQDTGGRNSYDLVEFMGFGDATASTGTGAITTARSMKLNTSTGETTFRSCVFGVDTISRTGANYNVELAGGAPRLTFENCDFEAMIGSGGTGGGFLLIGAAGIDRYVNFKNCRFINDVKSTGSVLTQAFNVSGSAGGLVFMDQCTTVGVTHLETTPSNIIFVNNAAPSITADCGIAVNNKSS